MNKHWWDNTLHGKKSQTTIAQKADYRKTTSQFTHEINTYKVIPITFKCFQL